MAEQTLKWADIEASDKFKSWGADLQLKAKQKYWDTIVIHKPEFQKLSDEDKDLAESKFFRLPKGTGASDTPTEKGTSYTPLDAVRKLGEGLGDVYGPSTEFINQAAFGAPRYLAGKAGLTLPEASSIPGKFFQNLAGIGGFAAGGPGRVAAKVGEKVAAKAAIKAAPKIIRAAAPLIAEGAAGGALTPGSADERIRNAAIGAAIAPVAVAGFKGAQKVYQWGAEHVPQAAGLLKQVPKALQFENLRKIDKSIQHVESSHAELAAALDDVRNSVKQVSSSHKDAVNSISYDSSKRIRAAVDNGFSSARSNYRQVMEALPEDVATGDNYLKIVEKVIKDNGILQKEVRTPAEEALLSHFNKYSKRLGSTPQTTQVKRVVEVPDSMGMLRKQEFVEDVISGVDNKYLSPEDLKNLKNETYNLLKSAPHLEASFLSNFHDMLSSVGYDGLSAANQIYKQAYVLKEAAKSLKRGTFKRVLGGGVPRVSREFSDLVGLEGSKFGTNTVEQAQVEFEKHLASKASAVSSAKRIMGDKQRVQELLKFLEKKRKSGFYKNIALGSTYTTLAGVPLAGRVIKAGLNDQ